MLLLLLVELLHQFVHFSFQRQDFLVRASVIFHLRSTTVVLFFVLFWGERHWLLVLRIVRKREVATSTTAVDVRSRREQTNRRDAHERHLRLLRGSRNGSGGGMRHATRGYVFVRQ